MNTNRNVYVQSFFHQLAVHKAEGCDEKDATRQAVKEVRNLKVALSDLHTANRKKRSTVKAEVHNLAIKAGSSMEQAMNMSRAVLLNTKEEATFDMREIPQAERTYSLSEFAKQLEKVGFAYTKAQSVVAELTG